jgi:hypothetical protein
MLIEHRLVRVTESPQQARRSNDVGEDERHESRRKRRVREQPQGLPSFGSIA